MRLAIVGRTHWLMDAARGLVGRGHVIALVATAPAAPDYRCGEAAFDALASEFGAPFLSSPDVNGPAFIACARASAAEACVSVNWPSIFRSETCELFPRGVLNAHAGDLPRYRGNACPNWAILNDEPHVGLCIHAMEPGVVDAGPIYARERFPLTETTYIGDVYAWMDARIPAMFADAVDRLVDPAFVPEDQALSGITPHRCFPRRPEDGLIDWSRPAPAIARLVRASSRPFAGAHTRLEGRERVTVWRARAVALDHDHDAVPGQIVGKSPHGLPLISCGEGVLEIQEASIEGRDRLPTSNRYRLFNARLR